MILPPCDHAPGCWLDGGHDAGVVEAGLELHLQFNVALLTGQLPQDRTMRGIGVVFHRHEIRQGERTRLGLESRLKDIGVFNVGLRGMVLVTGPEMEMTPSVNVQQGRKDTGGFQMGEAAPIEGTVPSDEGTGLQVANQPVLLEPLVVLCHLAYRLHLDYRLSSALTWATTLCAVIPNCWDRISAGALAPKLHMPTTAPSNPT